MLFDKTVFPNPLQSSNAEFYPDLAEGEVQSKLLPVTEVRLKLSTLARTLNRAMRVTLGGRLNPRFAGLLVQFIQLSFGVVEGFLLGIEIVVVFFLVLEPLA